MKDWKSIAQKRLERFRELQYVHQRLRCDIYNATRKALAVALHAKCIGDSEQIAAEVARIVSERITT